MSGDQYVGSSLKIAKPRQAAGVDRNAKVTERGAIKIAQRAQRQPAAGKSCCLTVERFDQYRTAAGGDRGAADVGGAPDRCVGQQSAGCIARHQRAEAQFVAGSGLVESCCKSGAAAPEVEGAAGHREVDQAACGRRIRRQRKSVGDDIRARNQRAELRAAARCGHCDAACRSGGIELVILCAEQSSARGCRQSSRRAGEQAGNIAGGCGQADVAGGRSDMIGADACRRYDSARAGIDPGKRCFTRNRDRGVGSGKDCAGLEIPADNNLYVGARCH